MVYLTGANGWLGLAVAEALASKKDFQGRGLRGLVLPGTGQEALRRVWPRIEIKEGDLVSGQGLAEFFQGSKKGVLIHTAGIIHPRKVREFYELNRDGTRNLLNAAVRAGVQRAVVVSSNSPCGYNPHPDHLFDEDSPYNPYMNYGKSKMEMEQMALNFHHRGDIEVVIVRAPWFYGPHQPPRQRLFIEMVRDGKAPIVGDGENLRSMAYTENLAEGLLLAAAADRAAGQFYWMADERPYSMNEIVDTIEGLLETEFGQRCAHRRLRLPGVAAEVAYGMDAGLQAMGLYSQKIHVLSEMNKTIACTIQKAKAELGYAPQFSLIQGMRKSIAEFFTDS